MKRVQIAISAFVFLLLLAFFVATSLLGLRNNQFNGFSILLAILLGAIIILIPADVPFLPRPSRGKVVHLILLVSMTLLPRLLWVNSLGIALHSDYKLYHELALDLSKGTLNSGTYIALFPHIYAYPLILSLIYKYVGAQILHAQMLNICLEVGIVLGVYWLGSKMLTPDFGLLSGVLVALWPSQIMFSSLVASEALFTFLLVGTICYAWFISSTQKALQGMISFAGLGVLIAAMNSVRPIGILFLISFVGYYLIFSRPIVPDEQWKTNRSLWIHKLLLVVCVCCLFFLANALIHKALEDRLDLKVGKSFIGYSLLVGSNPESGGMWNQSDADLQLAIYQVGKVHPDLVDRALLNQAVQRISSQPLAFIMLQSRKNYAMWQDDRYGIDPQQWTVKPGFLSAFIPSFLKAFYSMVNDYYFAILLLCIAGCIFALLNREQGYVTFIAIFLAGMVITFVFTEVQSRYHYPAIPLLTLLASYGLFHLRRKMYHPSRLASIGLGNE